MKIAFCGDILLRTPDQHRLGEKLKAKLDTCGVRCINFEVPIAIEHGRGIHKSGPVHSQSPDSPKWVMDQGFDLITLANNHSLDYGQEGIKETIKAFESVDITGIGTYDTAYDVCIIEKAGIKIGFLGLTHKEFGCVDLFTGEQLGTAALTSPKVFTSILGTRSKVDKLYVIAHAGVEMIEIPLPEWRELYRTFIDMGVDGVIASHPHVPQGFELYKDCPIVYSMGNFLFESGNLMEKVKEWFLSLMVIIDVSNNSFEVIPLIYDYQKKIVEIDDREETIAYMTHLNTLLEDPIYTQELRRVMNDLQQRYHSLMVMGGAYSLKPVEKLKNLIRPLLGRKRRKADRVHLLNLFQCESHRWTMMRLLGE